ncbi:unnamed protein product [Malus baccata var. baccata]
MPRRHGSPSPLLSPPLLIILFPIIISLILFYTIPPFLSLTSQLLRPTISVKKSWDSLNVFLVIFAILCGVFAKRNEDASPTGEDRIPDNNIPHPLDNVTTNSANISESEAAGSVLPQQWFGYSERRTPEIGGGRLRRSSSSYPDLRQLGQDSVWETPDHNKPQFRFFDDFEIGNYNRAPSTSHQRRSEEYSDVIKEIPVDTFVPYSSHPPPQKSPTPTPPPPPPPRQQKTRRTYQTVGCKDPKTGKVVNKHITEEGEEIEDVRTPPPTPPPPPPPRPAAQPSPIRIRSEPKRRKSNVKKEIAMVWASVLSNQRKRKKKHKVTGTRNIYETAASLPEHQRQGGEGEYFFTRPPPSPPPPPPPPPPPHSVFHNLFKKGMSKTKKVHSVSTPPTPPPPPPQPALRKQKSWNTSFPLGPPTPPQQPPPATSRRRSSASSGRPPLPTKSSSYLYEENVNSGSQSPLIPVAPPPPPPFKMPELKFFVRGDFVKIRSAESSRCGSPELEDVDDVDAWPRKEEDLKSKSEAQRKVNVMDSGDGGGGGGSSGRSSVFCPSPDVNTKADNFIARLRDEWKLEKMNSMRQKKKMP